MINAEVFIIFPDQDELLFGLKKAFTLYEISFEISGDPYNMIGSQQRDFFTNPTIFCSKSHLFKIAPFML